MTPRPPRISANSHRSRRGTIYVVVLALLMLMVASGAAAVAMSRTRTRTIKQANDTAAAELLAESAVEDALASMNSDSNWRTTYRQGVETSQRTCGRGTVSFKLVNENSSTLNSGEGDPVRIYGYGRVGSATQAVSVIAAGANALECLNAALVVDGTINFNKSTVSASGMTLASNSNISGGLGNVTGKVEAAGTINAQSWTLTGTQAAGVPARGMPGASVFGAYTAMGTSIPFSSLTVNGASGRAIQNCVLSPTSNPFGSGLNASGVYVVDCQNQVLSIRSCRIVGTLVVLNPGSGSGVTSWNTEGVNWAPAVSNYPCLLVNGDFRVEIGSSGTISEATLLTNFNPPGTPYPYPGGTTNATLLDSYPSRISGLVYISGNSGGNGVGTYATYVDMLMVGGNLDLDKNTLYLNYSNTYLTNPPPGFTGSGTMYPTAGTWRRENAP